MGALRLKKVGERSRLRESTAAMRRGSCPPPPGAPRPGHGEIYALDPVREPSPRDQIASSMQTIPSSSSSTSPLRRTLMLVATLGLGAVGWILLDEPDAVGAAESRPLGAVAIVDGAIVTEEEIFDDTRHELAELEARRIAILERAVETRVGNLLIDAEARRRGIDRQALLRDEIEAKLNTVAGRRLFGRRVWRSVRGGAIRASLRATQASFCR